MNQNTNSKNVNNTTDATVAVDGKVKNHNSISAFLSNSFKSSNTKSNIDSDLLVNNALLTQEDDSTFVKGSDKSKIGSNGPINNVLLSLVLLDDDLILYGEYHNIDGGVSCSNKAITANYNPT